MKRFFYVYILVSEEDETIHYTGVTQNVRERLRYHNRGACSHTSKCRPWRLETAIANAEARAYQESARPQNEMVTSSGSGYRWLIFGGGGFAALALAGGVVLYRRRIRLR